MTEVNISETEVKKAFYKSTEKAHVITCWVGIVLNLVWFVSDYFVLPDHWIQFSIFRFGVSILSAIALLLKKQFKISIYTCMFILVIGISIQNAYMWSVMDVAHFQQHAFAYMVLFIGVGMLVLWEVIFSLIILAITIISNIIFYILFSNLSVQEFVVNGALLILTVAIFCVFLIRTRYRLTYKEIRSRMELAHSKQIIEEEHAVVVEQKKEILDSINYAKRIQNAMLTSTQLFKKNLKDYFILFNPKDIVSGDFYWAAPLKDGKFVVITADSTGHGVPGAMMSLLNISCLNEAIIERKLTSPAKILDHARQRIINSLAEDGSAEGGKDGMDCSVIVFDLANSKLTYSGANNPVWIVRKIGEDLELIELKPDRMPVGKHDNDILPFTEKEIDLIPGDFVYAITDGFPDQFGGYKQKKFTNRKLRELCLSINKHPLATQQQILQKTFNDWKGTLGQVDDVLIIGILI